MLHTSTLDAKNTQVGAINTGSILFREYLLQQNDNRLFHTGRTIHLLRAPHCLWKKAKLKLTSLAEQLLTPSRKQKVALDLTQHFKRATKNVPSKWFILLPSEETVVPGIESLEVDCGSGNNLLS